MVARATALLVILATAGCYETKYQVFSRADSVAIPGLEGRYLLDMDGKPGVFTVFRADHGNDYRFHGEGPKKSDESLDGVFRAIRVDDDLYIAQFTPGSRLFDGNSKTRHGFIYQFFGVVRSGDAIVRIEQLETADSAAKDHEKKEQAKQMIQAIARRDAVDIWKSNFSSPGLSGSPAALRRFLLDLGHVPVATAGVYTRLP
jgi:hypothetical protein